MRSFLAFFWAALKNPLQVSTMFETGQTATDTLIDAVPSHPNGIVVELGVGTGAITKTLSKKVNDPSKYIGFELSEDLIEFVQERFPQLRFVKDSAEHFPKYLKGQKVAAVVSSLPWSVMPPKAVPVILDAIAENLAPGGVFTTYMTLHVLKTPAGRRFQQHMNKNFSGIETKVILENLPPAKIFIARK